MCAEKHIDFREYVRCISQCQWTMNIVLYPNIARCIVDDNMFFLPLGVQAVWPLRGQTAHVPDCGSADKQTTAIQNRMVQKTSTTNLVTREKLPPVAELVVLLASHPVFLSPNALPFLIKLGLVVHGVKAAASAYVFEHGLILVEH